MPHQRRLGMPCKWGYQLSSLWISADILRVPEREGIDGQVKRKALNAKQAIWHIGPSTCRLTGCRPNGNRPTGRSPLYVKSIPCLINYGHLFFILYITIKRDFSLNIVCIGTWIRPLSRPIEFFSRHHRFFKMLQVELKFLIDKILVLRKDMGN